MFPTNPCSRRARTRAAGGCRLDLKKATDRMPKKTLDFDEVGKIAMALADVEESSLHGATSWKVRKKLLACPAIHKSAEPHSLMVRIGPAERAQLLSSKPETYYLTDHYLSHSVVLVRLSKMDRKSLKSLLEGAWLSARANNKR
jgi:hypothetical protein